jgi:hypothetical protein
MKPRFFLAFIFTLLTLLSLPLSSNAQIPVSIDGVEMSVYPETPSPGTKVTVSVESFSTDLGSASILWQIDGKTLNKGVGMKSVVITAPQLGKTITVSAAIMTVEGREVKKSIVIKPAGVDLVWESEGYTPPLYKGKAFFAYQNILHVTAIPHFSTAGGEADPKTLTYKWTVNDKVVQNQSGYGKSSIAIQNDLPRPFEILVEVSTPTGSNKAASRIQLTPGEPSISFYEEDPLYGVLYNRAIIDQIRLGNQEISIRAVPFAFSIFKNFPLTFNWSVNNLERSDLSTNESITLRTKGDTEGTSRISLSIRNAESILQGAERAIGVQFSKKKADTAIFQ